MMAAYLLFSMPLMVLISATLGRSADTRLHAFTDTPRAMLGAFAPGVVAAVVALLLLNAVRPGLEGSYRFGRVYLAALLGDQLLPLVVAALGIVGLNLARAPWWDRRPSFAVGLSYLGGYFTVLSVTEYLAARSELTVHVLFLMPTLRIVGMVVYARVLERLGDGGRRPSWITVAVPAVLPLVLALEGYWARLGRVGAAVLLTGGLAAMTVLGLILRSGNGGAGRTAGS